MFNHEQKRLILRILMKERERWFSKNKGKLLDKTISDLFQMIRNESHNPYEGYDKALDWFDRDRRK